MYRTLLLALTLLATPALATESAARSGKIVDLTHAMHEAMPYWPGGVPFRIIRLVDYDRGYRLHRFEMGENTGTHVDAPAHFIAGARSIEAIPPSELVVPAVVVDVRAQVARDPDYALTVEDLRAWERRHGRIPSGSLVILNTGWHRRFGDPVRYINADEQGVMHFPGFGKESAKRLVERNVAGIGIDTLSIDPGPSTDFAAHRVMLQANKYQIENLANLDALPPTGAVVFVGVLKVREGSQAQARVLALVP